MFLQSSRCSQVQLIHNSWKLLHNLLAFMPVPQRHHHRFRWKTQDGDPHSGYGGRQPYAYATALQGERRMAATALSQPVFYVPIIFSYFADSTKPSIEWRIPDSNWFVRHDETSNKVLSFSDAVRSEVPNARLRPTKFNQGGKHAGIPRRCPRR